MCESKSNVWHREVDIRCLACWAQQKAITLKFGAKSDHHQTREILCVSVDNLADAVDRLLIYHKQFRVQCENYLYNQVAQSSQIS